MLLKDVPKGAGVIRTVALTLSFIMYLQQIILFETENAQYFKMYKIYVYMADHYSCRCLILWYLPVYTDFRVF